MDDRLWTWREVCEWLQCSHNTLFRLIRSEGLPSIKLGHDYRFRPDAIREWVREREGVGA